MKSHSTQKTLTDLRTVKLQGSTTQIARLPLSNEDHWFSPWIAYNGNASEYEIRFRLSRRDAQELQLPE